MKLALGLIALLPLAAQELRLPPNLEKLGDKAREVVDVTLDGPLLQLAARFLSNRDPDEARAKKLVQGLKGIYVKNFEFDEPNQYSQADVDAIRAQLAAPGWSKIVESRSLHSREHDEIYVMKQGNAIAGMAVLVAEPRELTVVNIVGNIDVDKLAALEGHLGIPGDNGGRHKRRHKPDDSKPSKDKSSQSETEAEDDAN